MLSSAPKASVLIPTVRYDDYLVEAIESVIDQRDVGEVEVIVVADGVTNPDELARLRAWPVRTISLPRRVGTPTALNVGIGLARAPFVARLDADDIADGGRIAKQLDAFDRDPSLVVHATAANLIDQHGRHLGVMGAEMSGEEVVRALTRANCIVHSSVMYRKDAVVSVGGYDGRCLRMQDYELWLRLASAGNAFHITAEPLVSYRVHVGQHSRKSPPRGEGFRTVRRARSNLARTTGSTTAGIVLSDMKWTGAQWLRHLGLRQPGYEAMLNKAGT